MLQAESVREKMFNLRMSPDEWARLESLAAHYETSAAAVVRMLVKRDADQLTRLTAERGGNEKWGRVALRAQAEEDTGVSLACPTFFKASIASAAGGERGGYKAAASNLARHLASLVEDSDEATEKLGAIVNDPATTYPEAAKQVIEWVRNYLPRCFALVPSAKLSQFAKGFEEALEEGRIL